MDTQPWAAPTQPRFLSTILGDLERVTAPSGLLITLDKTRKHLRVEHGDDDDLITDQLAAATAFCEQEIDGHRQFLQATYDVPVRCWWEKLKLPRPPLQTLTSISYYDSAGALQIVPATTYEVKKPWRQPGVIRRAPGKSWPSYQADREFPIVIRFVAGYADAASVPATVKQAVLMVVGHWYENREAWITGTITAELGTAVAALLQSEGYGFYGGS